MIEKETFRETNATIETNVSKEDIQEYMEAAADAAGQASKMAKEAGKMALEAVEEISEAKTPWISSGK